MNDHPLLDTDLPNGLRLLVVPDRTVPLVEIRLSIPFAGAGEAHAATAQVLGDVLLRPTDAAPETRSTAWRVAELDCGRDMDRLGVFGYAPTASLRPVLRGLAACLAEPRYPDAWLGQARRRLAAQVGIGRGDARWMALATALRRRHAAGATPCDIPTPEALAAVEPAAVRALHRSRIVPRGATLVLVGDVGLAEAAALVEEACAEWRGAGEPNALVPLLPPAAHELALLHRPRSAQAELLMTGQAPPRAHELRPAFDIANAVFGGGVASRLSRNVREAKGYAYLAGSAVEPLVDTPTVMVRLAVGERHVAAALRETRRELAALAESPLDRDESDSAKRLLAGRLALSRVSPSAHATFLANLIAEGVGPRWTSSYPERLAAVGRAESLRAVRTYLSLDALDTVVVGDADALAGPLGEIEGLRVRRYERLDEVTAAPAERSVGQAPGHPPTPVPSATPDIRHHQGEPA
ncbi:M16 family metallopeptidase [Streptomyces sp. NPDC127098]|uniref:M16 family metallopeptidase n=1 Tax=Streptomyces sp. NPDC127098 TaxID=3347137 RepID=UPI003658C37E